MHRPGQRLQQYRPGRRSSQTSSDGRTSRFRLVLNLLLAPMLAAKALLLLPALLSFSEKPEGSEAKVHQSDRLGLSLQWSLVVPRMVYCAQDLRLLWQALVYNLMAWAMQLLAADGIVATLQSWIEGAGNKIAGAEVTTYASLLVMLGNSNRLTMS